MQEVDPKIHDCQCKIIYSLLVAGKNATFADKKLKALLDAAGAITGTLGQLPFDMLRPLGDVGLMEVLQKVRTGNYGKMFHAIKALLEKNFDLTTVTPMELETIFGIGPKTSRFFVLWTRPHERYAVLDVHVLRWLRKRGCKCPTQTPDKKKYARIERWYLKECDRLRKTPRELDMKIWEQGAKRTQATPIPEPLKSPE